MFVYSQVEYLGHIISTNTMAMDPKKIACMLEWSSTKTLKELLEWSSTKTLKELRGFLGLTGYY